MSQGKEFLIPQVSLGGEDMMDGGDMMEGTDEGMFPIPIQTLSMTSLDTLSTDIEEGPPEEKGRLDVRVKPSAVLRSNSIQGSQMKAYPMNRSPRGYALIIDIEVYENDIHERRLGSHVDVYNLKNLLEQLSFDVRVFKDLARANFYKELSEFASYKLHAQANMAIVAILSHGKDGIVYAADGQSIDMEYIYEFFNNKNCPSLQGKPKFFIVQSCRGDMSDQGVVEADSGASGHSDNKRKRKADTDKVQDGTDRGSCSKARPTWEDMIIAYSTIPGYASLRDHDRGTWFIQSLVEVFMEHAHNTELIDLLRMTSARLSEFENEQGEKQTCNIEMRHLYKRIYFNPGLVMSGGSDSASSASSDAGARLSLPPPGPAVFPQQQQANFLLPTASFGAGARLHSEGEEDPPLSHHSLTRSRSTPPMSRKMKSSSSYQHKQQ
eukprot:TRINITY_DN6158_c0_g1_i2.p1 TRINITY_DN6158_c0_g1~~TRINITY_DN6158_c0_g1_i2.p1  ORF type:complete len:437 (-),score=95.93 TRINITY_DN6158_c0_g1_i2:1072-2382(-)